MWVRMCGWAAGRRLILEVHLTSLRDHHEGVHWGRGKGGAVLLPHCERLAALLGEVHGPVCLLCGAVNGREAPWQLVTQDISCRTPEGPHPSASPVHRGGCGLGCGSQSRSNNVAFLRLRMVIGPRRLSRMTSRWLQLRAPRREWGITWPQEVSKRPILPNQMYVLFSI